MMNDKVLLTLATIVSLFFIMIRQTDPIYTLLFVLASVFMIMWIQDLVSKGRAQDEKNM